MPTAAVPLPFELDAPLPAELAGRHQGWLTRYRRYPVFSAPWVRGRWLSLGLLVSVGFAVAFVPVVLLTTEPASPSPLGGLTSLALLLALPLWLGPLLGRLVRRQGWAPRREWIGLVAAVAAAMAAALSFAQWGTEPLKQRIAEWRGSVDEHGRRKRMVLSFGVTVAEPGKVDPKPVPEPADDLSMKIGNAVSLALMSFWLAGGPALTGWRRERTELAALARERELAQAQQQRREAELRLSVLAAQVEPHFLFNTLAGVRSAIATDPARASDMIDRLVDYLRASIPRLRSDGQVQATLGAQLDIVRAYLGLMASRMPRLQWQVSVAPDLLGARCPPLMLISLAENAIKHGVERKVGPARVDVTAARGDDGRLQVTVADDGPGFQPSASGSGLGLSNVRQRLAQLYPGQADLALKARPEGGVAATLSLPLEVLPPAPPAPAA